MPILAIFTGKGMTRDSYDDLRKEVDWEHQQPAGGIVHVAGYDDSDSIHAADIWESAEAMNEFVNNRLMPALKKLNIPPPDVKIYTVHNVNAYSEVDQYKI